MSRFRLFILWIVFVCVPLQGHAATAMALCVPAQAGGGIAVRTNHEGHAVAGIHAVSEGHHDPVPGAATTSMVEHPDHLNHPGPGQGAHPCHDGVPHAEADEGASADAPHACGTCAACHAAALTGQPDVAVLHDLPPADLAEPALVAATRVPRPLDRPPRA